MRRAGVWMAVWGLACRTPETAKPPSSLTTDTGSLTTTSTTPPTVPTTVSPSPVVLGPWVPCALFPGQDTTPLAECAIASLPRNHDDLDAGSIEALVKRLPAVGPEQGQLWLLHGGPGASAVDDLALLAAGLPQARPDLGYYAVDHRGIGGTERLGCPDQESPQSVFGAAIAPSEWDACIAGLVDRLGDDLNTITTTASARDVGSLVDALADPNKPVFVYGGSYGTWLGQRYLQLFPNQPTGVILDGIQPATASFVGYDARMNQAGRDLMAGCADTPACASHFGAENPWEVAERTVAALDGGHCSLLGMTSEDARAVLGYLTLYHPLRDLVPATVHRLDRCTIDDAEALLSLVVGLFGATPASAPLASLTPSPGGNDGVGRSTVLGMHISLSELWVPFDPPALDVVQAELPTLTMALGQTQTYALLADQWPIFAPDRWHRTFAAYEGPLLLLQGVFDSATQFPQAAPLAEVYDGPAQTFVAFPWGAHGLLEGTPLADGTHCAEHIAVAFLDDPLQPLDLGCVAETLPPNFDGDPLYALFLLGTTDVWGD